jgi:HAD superfamily hydrolase (TIGR01509 family)
MPHDAGTRPAAMRPGSPEPAVALVIFDCDGVLIDSEIVVCRITAEELSRIGFRVSTEEVVERFAGRPEREMVVELESQWGRTIPEAFFERIRAQIEHAYGSELQVIPGVAGILEKIRVDICVASSSYPAKLELGLKSTGLHDRFFPHIVSAVSVAHGKPAPDIFVYAAGWMHTPVASCLVIEDSVPGTRAAVAAGMRVIGFAGGSHCGPDHRSKLLEAGASHVFDAYDQLPALLPGLFEMS